MKRALDLYCGVGGWSKGLALEGWDCTGIDLCDFSKEYPGRFIQSDARAWFPRVREFDLIVASPPCEEFARAWLPWLRGDKAPAPWAVDLLRDTIALADVPNGPPVIVECSRFAARHVPGARFSGSYALWGDVPVLLPALPHGKMKKTGKRPELRAEIPFELSRCVGAYFK